MFFCLGSFVFLTQSSEYCSKTIANCNRSLKLFITKTSLGPRKYSGALWSNASNIIIDLGEFKKALNYYEQSIQLSPDFMQMYKGYQADLALEHLFLWTSFARKARLNPKNLLKKSNCIKSCFN